jgi:hypothetical protein
MKPNKTNTIKIRKSNKRCTRKSSKDPRVFGPDMWATLHRISVNYPNKPNKNTRKNAIKFIESLPYMIPCTHCGCHFSNFIKENNLNNVSKNKNNIVSFFVNAHNNVSKHTNPKNKPWNTEQAIKKYKYENKCFHSKLWYDCDINKCENGFKNMIP